LLQAKPLAPMFAREKMPFEVSPVFLNLKRQSTSQSSAQGTAQGAAQAVTK